MFIELHSMTHNRVPTRRSNFGLPLLFIRFHPQDGRDPRAAA
jgi:hypothetical protein